MNMKISIVGGARGLFLGLLAILAALALLFAGHSRDVRIAEQAVEEFHSKFNAGEFGSIYDNTSDELRNSIPRQKFISTLLSLHNIIGDEHASSEDSASTLAGFGGTQVTLYFTTEFSGANQREKFIFRIESGHASLVLYSTTKA